MGNFTAGCNLTYLQFACEFTCGVIVVSPAIAGIFNCNCAYFCLGLRVFLPEIAGILLAIEGNFACGGG